jgi:hypothetical protein
MQDTKALHYAQLPAGRISLCVQLVFMMASGRASHPKQSYFFT